MQTDEDVVKVLPRFEAVEQIYDGLNGKIVKWTLENGNSNHDPSILAFVVRPDGTVFSSLMNGQQYQAGSFAKWAKEQANAYGKAHPSTRLPFARADVTLDGEGTDAKAVSKEFDAARADDQPVMLYFGRGHHAPDDKTGKKQTKAARTFEKKVLDSKSAEKQAEGWVFLRFDLADDLHARLAEQLGVTSAPTLLAFAPEAETPVTLDARTTGAKLAAALKKHRVAPQPE